MHGSAWVPLLRRIPPAQHNSLMLVTSIGTEFTIQDILRIEEDFLVMRARLAGSTDTGRAFFIPYDQINYLGFQKGVKEAEVQALFGDPGVAGAAAEAESPTEGGPPVNPAEGPAGPAAPQEPAKPAAAQPLPRRSGVLASLRARVQASAKGQPHER